MISIITTVYNTEKYLPRCLDSILAQTYQDWELLLINDGSTDHSAEICDDYASRDARIRVYNKENGGVASARQLGIEQAQGEYSIHIDSDDWIEPQMLEDMLQAATSQRADVVVADFYKDREGLSQLVSHNFRAESAVADLLNGAFQGFLWNKLIRHELYKKHHISFLPGINLCEDLLICIRLFQLPIKVATISRAYYHYMHNGVSSMAKKYDKRMYEAINLFLEEARNYTSAQYRGIIQERLSYNELIALLQGVKSVNEAYKEGVRISAKHLFARSIGIEGRVFVLFYLLGLVYFCELMVKNKIIRV